MKKGALLIFKSGHWRLVCIFLVIGLTLFSTLQAWAAQAKLPPSILIASHAVGSTFHATGSAIGKIVSDNSPMTMIVRPHPGPPAWLPAMNNGEMEFGILSSADAAAAYRGVAQYRTATPNVRLAAIGAPLYLAWWVPLDSGIKTIADLKGKRVPSGWKGLPVIHFSAGAALSTASLTWDDVVQVPVAELSENVRAFLEGRTDAFWHSVGSPAVQEADARMRGGIRALPIGTSTAGLKRMVEVYPGSYKSELKKGYAAGVVESTVVMTNDMYLLVPAVLSGSVVEAVLTTLWDHNETLRKVSPLMRLWTRDRMVSGEASIPFHSAAIAFYREKGLWSAVLEKHQAELDKR